MSKMLTETSFHHLNGGSVIAQHRTHYAPYQHQSYASKSSPQQQQQNDLQAPKFDLHQAVRTNDVAGIIRLHSRLRQQPAVADNCLLDSNGHTPLYTAIANGRLTMVDLLLQLGHNPVNELCFFLFRKKKSINTFILVLHIRCTRIGNECCNRLQSFRHYRLPFKPWFSGGLCGIRK